MDDRGSGIIHSELPEQEEGLMHGFQLWINLPAREDDRARLPGRPSGTRPSRHHERGCEYPNHGRIGGGHGGCDQARGERTAFLDLDMPAGSACEVPIPAGHNAFLYAYEGRVEVGTRGGPVRARQLAVLTNSPDAGGVRLQASGRARLLLVAGRPLNEPIVQ